MDSWEYTLGVKTRDEYFTAKELGTLKSKEELVAERCWADYVYGPVSGRPNLTQIAFKRSRAFAVLNASPRTIYKVNPGRKLEFVKRIDPR